MPTVVSISGESFLINGVQTYPNGPLTGTLPNARCVNATFEDTNGATVGNWSYPGPVAYDPARQTNEFVAALPSWKAKGLLAVTLNMQGGNPKTGVTAYVNTAFNNDGTLRAEYLTRLAQAITGLDANGMVAILGYFYFGANEAPALTNPSASAAITAATTNATNWVLSQGYKNVLIEIANEVDNPGNTPYTYPAPLQPANVDTLVQLVHNLSSNQLKVGVSFVGGTVPTTSFPSSIAHCDFVLLHGNNQTASTVTSMINSTRSYNAAHSLVRPIIVNEDSVNIPNFDAAVAAAASWGYHDSGTNNYVDGLQSPPTNWAISSSTNKTNFFNRVAFYAAQTTGGGGGGGGTNADKTVTVTNTGTGTLNWSVTVPAPFSVVGTSSGALSATQSTQVTLHFGPTVAGSYSGNAVFSGGQGATVALSGSATSPISGLTFNADAGTITGPFTIDSVNHTITETTSVTTPGAGGQARYNVTIPTTGDYVVNATVNCPDGGSNSFWINFDSDPTDPLMIWDVVQFTTGFQQRFASWRGTGTFDQPQFTTKVWTLTAGTHQLVIFGREPNAQIQSITIQHPSPVIPPAPAAPSSPTPANGATNVSINSGLSWTEATAGTLFNVSLGSVNPPPVVATGLSTTSYTPSPVLANATIYYWQVRSYINWSSQGQSGTVFTDSPVWSFTTAPVPPPVNQPPVAGISADVTAGQGPFSVTFTLTSHDPDGTVASGLLDYGDGSPTVPIASPGASITRTHTYGAVGSLTTYTAIWSVTDNLGLTSDPATVNIADDTVPPPPPNQPPVAGLSGSPTSGTGPFTVNFTLTSTDPDGTVASGVLDYGDGSPTVSITSPPASTTRAHIYAKVLVDTNYTASWTITDNLGATNAKSVIIADAAQPPPPNQPPVAGITSDKTSGVGSVLITFTLTSSDPDGTVASGVLNYGDGAPPVNYSSPASSFTQAHNYPNVLTDTTYVATWQVTDNLGATSPIVTRNILVSPKPVKPPIQPPVSGISVSPSSGFGPFQTTFTLTSSDPNDKGTVVSGLLDFGDGSTLTLSNPGATVTQAHTYASVLVNHTYVASWQVTNNSGLISSLALINVFVQATPQPPVTVLTSPVEGEIFAGPATVPFAATVAPGTNPVAKVEFYQGTTLVGTDTTAPYTFSWGGVTAGDYTLKAIAYDNQSVPLTGTSPVRHIHVMAPGTAVVPQIIFVTP